MAVIKLSDFKEFPACDVLGYSLDFTTASPANIKSVLASVKRGRRIIAYEPDQDTRKLDVGGVIYDVPKYISVSEYNSSDGTYVTFSSGTEAASTFKTDATLSARYLAVSANASASYSIDKTFRREDQWAMYSFNADTYLASLKDYADLLAEEALLKRLTQTVPIGNGSNTEIVQDWKDFFASWGSHVIINSAFGAKYQFGLWASNSYSTVNERFSTNVTAAMNGIGSGGEFDAGVEQEEQYKTFSELMTKDVAVVGGDEELNEKLAANSAQYDLFVEWAATASRSSSIASLNVIELWVLMKDAAQKGVRDAAQRVMDAYHYIVLHPKPYKTHIVFDIQSDWAEFNLLSSSSVIIPDIDNPLPPDDIVASNTRVRWGKSDRKAEKRTLRFFVVNDGSPIDFSISHGSDGAEGGKGRAEVLMERESYVNNQITDNAWNTVWFYQKLVSSVPASTNAELTYMEHSWNSVLKGYLEEIGASDWL